MGTVNIKIDLALQKAGNTKSDIVFISLYCNKRDCVILEFELLVYNLQPRGIYNPKDILRL
jgi:hypothetical protein